MQTACSRVEQALDAAKGKRIKISGWFMRNYLKGGLTVILVLIIVTFAIKNNQAVQLHYYFNTLNIQLPAYALVFLSLLIGFLLGFLIAWCRSRRLKKQSMRLERNRDCNSTE